MRTPVIALSLLLPAALLACESRKQLTPWQPSDHQPPPSVVPEGQGAADEGSGSGTRAVAALWATRCASCHGATGQGDGPGRPPGSALPDMSSPAYANARSDAELHQIIAKGRGLMPGFADQLSELGIDALVQHVRSLSRQR